MVENGACFIYQTGPIWGHTARVKLVQNLQYNKSTIVINIHLQSAMLLSASIKGKPIPLQARGSQRVPGN